MSDNADARRSRLMRMKDRLFPPLNRAAERFNLPLVPEGKAIPRLIHQTFRSRNLPVQLLDNVQKMKSMNPGWTHQIYDDADVEAFIKAVYGRRVLAYFHRINPKYGAARADLFRYLLLYKYGGVYLDIKSTLSKPLDGILLPDDRYLLSQWRNGAGDEHQGWGLASELSHVPGGEFQQWHIVAAPGHPFLRAVIENVLTNIDRYNPWLHGTGSSGVFRVTGPTAYTLAIVPLLGRHPHRRVRDQDCGFEYTLFKTVSHRPLFSSHYAKQTESVIRLDGVAAFSGWLYDLLKRGKRRCLRIFRRKAKTPGLQP